MVFFLYFQACRSHSRPAWKSVSPCGQRSVREPSPLPVIPQGIHKKIISRIIARRARDAALAFADFSHGKPVASHFAYHFVYFYAYNRAYELVSRRFHLSF